MLGYDVDPDAVGAADRRPHGACADRSPATRRWSPASTGCSSLRRRARADQPHRDEVDCRRPGSELGAARRSTCTPTCARSTPSRGAAADASSSASARARPLRRRRARAHARARGRLLPAVPSQQRSEPARRGGASPSSTAASSRPTRSSAWCRDELPRRARPADRHARGPRPGARRPRARGALPLLRRAADRGRAPGDLRGGGARTSTRWPPTRRATTATSASPRWSSCPQPLAPLLSAPHRAAPARRCAACCSR